MNIGVDIKPLEERITKLVLKVDSEAESLQGLCDGWRGDN